jgi:ABC-2 type transport system permease protein
MIKLLFLFWYDLKNKLNDTRAVIIMALVPFLMILLVGYAAVPLLRSHSLVEQFSVALVNQDNSLETRTMINHLESSEELSGLFLMEKVDYAEAMDLLTRNRVAAVIVIPPGFGESIAMGKNRPLELTGNQRRPLQSSLVRVVLQSAADLVTAAQSGVNTVYYYLRQAHVSGAELDRSLNQSIMSFMLSSLGRTRVLQTVHVSSLANLSPLEYYSVSFALLFLMLTGMISLKSTVTESEDGVVRRLLAQGVRPLQVVSARFFSLTLVLAVQFSLLLLLLVFFVDGYFRGQLFHLVLASAAAVAAAAGLLLLLACCTSNVTALNMLGFTLIAGMAITGGGIVPLAYLPEWLRPLQQLSFNKWAAQGLYQALFGTVSGLEWALGSTIILTATAVFSLCLSATVLKWKMR